MSNNLISDLVWTEDLTSSKVICTSICKSLNNVLQNFRSFTLPESAKPGVVVFDCKCQLENVIALVQARIRNGCSCIVAIAVKTDSINHHIYCSLLRAGATDVLCWDTMEHASTVIAERIERFLTIERLITTSKISDVLIGNSARWLQSLREITEVALFSSSSILITGESGTGKELVSHLIHKLDSRKDKGQLTLVDCTTIMPELSGSEFFGHERGAFTNAVSARDGAFSLADKGTLFLDEVGELPLRLQSELLRVIQEGTFKRIGSNVWKQTDFRLVAATNRNLLKEVNNQHFRQDLYFRISGWVIELPPLRKRVDDIPLLAQYFLKKALKQDKNVEIDPNLLHYLVNRTYEGNIRELKQLMHRLALKYTGNGPFTLGMLPKEELASFPADEIPEDINDHTLSFHDVIRKKMLTGASVKEIKERVGDIAKELVIEEENGNLQRAASRLGVTDRSLQLWRIKMKTMSNAVDS